MYSKDELQRKVDELQPWHYCHILPYGISTGCSNVPVQSEKLLLLDKCGVFPDPTYPEVLDLGANSGLIGMWFVDNKQSHVIAMENDDRFYPQLELAVGAKGYSSKIVPLRYDVTKGNYGENLYDLVLFLGVMHYLHSQAQSVVFEASYASLKVGGTMVVQTTKDMFVLQRLKAAGFKNCKRIKDYEQGDRLAWSGDKHAAKAKPG